MPERIIALIDGNCFFASCYQATDPGLRGKPVVVAGDPERRQGVVLAVSYEARRLARGPVHAGMPLAQALRLLPRQVILRPPDQRLFGRISDRLYALLGRFSPLNERASIDEVYADWTGCTHLFGGDPVSMARQVKAAIAAEVGVPVSVGIGWSKVVAKVAAELQKPDGLTWLTPADWVARVYPLPVGALFGVGPRTVPKLRRWSIETVGDLAAADPVLLRRAFGVYGEQMRLAARGEDSDPVRPTELDPAKSISHATTLARNVRERDEQRRILLDLTDMVGGRLRQAGLAGRTVTLTIRDPAFQTITRSHSLARATDLTEEIYAAACQLLDRHWPPGKPVRLLGVGIANLRPVAALAHCRQLSLFDAPAPPDSGTPAPPPPVDVARKRRLDQAVDAIRARFGESAALRLTQLGSDLHQPLRSADKPAPSFVRRAGEPPGPAAGDRRQSGRAGGDGAEGPGDEAAHGEDPPRKLRRDQALPGGEQTAERHPAS